MNRATLLRLKNNPHYKLSAAQQRQLDELERKPMVEFGVPPVNKNGFEKHEVRINRRKRQ